jgi:hypothetical protein
MTALNEAYAGERACTIWVSPISTVFCGCRCRAPTPPESVGRVLSGSRNNGHLGISVNQMHGADLGMLFRDVVLVDALYSAGLADQDAAVAAESWLSIHICPPTGRRTLAPEPPLGCRAPLAGRCRVVAMAPKHKTELYI